MENYKYMVRLFETLTICLFIISCEDGTSTENIPDQLFRPALLTADINGNVVTLSWVPISNASYSLEISKDSFLFENELEVFSLDGMEEYTVENLWSDSRYSVRIQAISKNEMINDSEYRQITFVTGTENIFYTIPDENIGVNRALLQWDKSKDVSKIDVLTGGIVINTIALSSSDISTGQKLVEDLNEGTTYVFKIYLGEMIRGTITVMTKLS